MQAVDVEQSEKPNNLPKKNSLSRADWDQWAKDTIIYNLTPVIIVFLTSLNSSFVTHGSFPSSSDFVLAAGTAYGALLAALINLLSKYKGGV